MKSPIKASILFLTLFLTTSFLPQRIDYRDARYKNVCKDLRSNALLYFIFIDSKETSPWTEFDIISTIDSINIAMKWIEGEAAKNNVNLSIKSDYYIGKDFTTITRRLPQGTVAESLKKPTLSKGIIELNRWADNIARKAGESFFITDKDGIPKQQNPKDVERLIALLRDEFSVESVALMFMVNNYFKEDISIAINTFTTDKPEYSIVSYKYPSEIAHNFLHLYGAADMYETPYRKSAKNIKILEELFPNEIMQDPYAKNINSLEISEYTRYLIGWSDEMDKKYENLMKDKLINLN